MHFQKPKAIASSTLSRRRFVRGVAGGGVLLAGSSLFGSGRLDAREPGVSAVPQLHGSEFHLIVGHTPVNFTGVTRTATTINGSIPAPTLVWEEGREVTIHVTNHLPETTSIHWHGFILPYQMDGVPGISYRGILPGETFTYRFKVKQNGTYWYHSHTGFQEITGMYGSIIVVPKGGDTIQADRDYVVQFSDWTDEDPWQVFAKLKQQSDYYNFNQPTAGQFFDDVQRNGLSRALDRRKMWNQMRMSPTDLSDTSASIFTYLLNGSTPARNWTGIFQRGERLRLRFINGASNTFFDVRIPGLKLTVVAADSQNVEPVSVDEFRFGPGETYDVIVQPTDDAHTIFAQSMDRSGYVRGTLAVAEGLSAPVPELDEVQWLTMTDMMGAMSANGAHGNLSITHSSMTHSSMTHSSMNGMMDHDSHGNNSSGNQGHMSMDHGQHMSSMYSPSVPSQAVRHARTEYGPSVDMRVDTPRTNLDDPGIGLRDNGRRVLTLADLHTIGGPLDKRMPARELELHLTGNMERYSWSFDGLEFGQSTPVHFKHGERLRVILHNDTMMTHPMHMHGLWSELENDRGEFVARRHTIVVQPAQRISFQVTADALGRWAWHCHLLFHMHMGMFREVVVA